MKETHSKETHPKIQVTQSGSRFTFDPNDATIPTKGTVEFDCSAACLLCFSDSDFFKGVGGSYHAKAGPNVLEAHDKPDGNKCVITGAESGRNCAGRSETTAGDSCTVVIGSGEDAHHQHHHRNA